MFTCFHSDTQPLDLPPDHPFPVAKYAALRLALSKSAPSMQAIEAPPATRIELLRAHTAAYLDALESATLPPQACRRLGLPSSPQVFTRFAADTEATRRAALHALAHGASANLGGGTHHGFPSHGEGFCALNDIAVAALHLRSIEPDLRILVIDTDAHQGNGNHCILAPIPGILTYSIHVERNFPTNKHPGTLDVGLPRFVDGKDYLKALRDTLPGIIRNSRPDFIFWVSGADCHVDDAFGQMRLDDRQMGERDQRVIALAHASEARFVQTLGGGYNARRDHIVTLHERTLLACIEAYD